MSVRTRFAPSPTGYLHIGGVRTALFCWLFARRHRGQFILRIDDTDQQRNVEAALAPILSGFRWLGIDWDEGPEVGGPHEPYFQSQRTAAYQAAVDRLIELGAAYYDYATPEEFQQEREAAEKEKRPWVYSRKFLAVEPEQREKFESEGRNAVVRLKMPREGTLVIEDLVRGRVEFGWAGESDAVIQRADGTFLYHLASVVDDHDFRITHVIRAEEHLSNTPRQVFIAQSLDYPVSQFAHLPYVAEPGSRNKLSKRKLDKYLKNRDFAKIARHGQEIAERLGLDTSAETLNPVIVDFYRQVGYLPEALLNYLLLLGWSLDESTEQFTREQMIEHFSLERVNKAPASFDPSKLQAFQQRYMDQLPVKQKVALMVPFLQAAGLVASPPNCEVGPKLTKIVTAAADRLAVGGDILDYADFFTPDGQLPYDEKALEKRLRKPPQAARLLALFRQTLAAAESFDAPSLERLLKQFVEQKEIKIGEIIHALRVAVTGKAVGFGMFETLEILGKESSLRRIDRALGMLDA